MPKKRRLIWNIEIPAIGKSIYLTSGELEFFKRVRSMPKWDFTESEMRTDRYSRATINNAVKKLAEAGYPQAVEFLAGAKERIKRGWEKIIPIPNVSIIPTKKEIHLTPSEQKILPLLLEMSQAEKINLEADSVKLGVSTTTLATLVRKLEAAGFPHINRLSIGQKKISILPPNVSFVDSKKSAYLRLKELVWLAKLNDILSSNEKITKINIAKRIGISHETLRRFLNRLKSQGLEIPLSRLNPAPQVGKKSELRITPTISVLATKTPVTLSEKQRIILQKLEEFGKFSKMGSADELLKKMKLGPEYKFALSALFTKLKKAGHPEYLKWSKERAKERGNITKKVQISRWGNYYRKLPYFEEDVKKVSDALEIKSEREFDNEIEEIQLLIVSRPDIVKRKENSIKRYWDTILQEAENRLQSE